MLHSPVEEFALATFKAPATVIVQLGDSEPLQAEAIGKWHARRAVCWFGLLCMEEGFDSAQEALKYRGALDPYTLCSALHVRAATARYLADAHAEQMDTNQRESLWKQGLLYTDLHVAMAINHAAWMISIDAEVPAIEQQVAVARRIFQRTRYQNEQLRTVRYLLLEYVRIGAGLRTDIASAFQELLSFMAVAERAGVPEFAALGHMSLGDLYRASHLYSPSVVHGAAAVELWASCGRDDRKIEALIIQAKTFVSLGLTIRARELLDLVPRSLVGSRGRYLDSERLQQLSSIYSQEGDQGGAARYALACARTTPEIVLGDPTKPVLNWVQACIRTRQARDEPGLNEARVGFHLAIERVPPANPWYDFARELETIVEARSQEVDTAIERFRTKWPDFRGTDGLGADLILGKVLRAFLDVEFGVQSLEDDLTEYWEHIQHLSGEDDEVVRSHYRVANCLPVLHRLLVRGELGAELQFELIELARFGAIAAHLSDLETGLGPRGLRRVARDHLLNVGYDLPAVYGNPVPLTTRGASSKLTEMTGVNPVALEEVIPCDQNESPVSLLQLYLRGRAVHFVYRPTNAEAIAGTYPLSPRSAGILNVFKDLMTPKFGSFEARNFGIVGGDRTALAALAGARTAVGPMINDRDLAADLLGYLDRRFRANAWRDLLDLDVPPLSELCRALGELFPSCLVREPPTGKLAISTDLELATLPLSLAQLGDKLLLEAHGCLSLLPPLNLIMVAGRAVLKPQTWSVIRVGNTLGDLSYAGPPSREDEVTNAFAWNDEAAASGTAVVYRGHLAEPVPGMPSSAGIYASPTAVLRANTLLKDPRPWRTPARMALLACRAAGWDLGGEWGGLGAAAMLRGTQEVVAPLWPLVDAPSAEQFDEAITDCMAAPDLHGALSVMLIAIQEDWASASRTAIPPHWWASVVLMSR
ncbi:MAG: hypothetical protein ACRCYU_16070 [Nocardioides sp.]